MQDNIVIRQAGMDEIVKNLCVMNTHGMGNLPL